MILACLCAFQPATMQAQELTDSVLHEALGHGRSLFCVDIVSKRTEKEPLIGLTDIEILTAQIRKVLLIGDLADLDFEAPIEIEASIFQELRVGRGYVLFFAQAAPGPAWLPGMCC